MERIDSGTLELIEWRRLIVETLPAADEPPEAFTFFMSSIISRSTRPLQIKKGLELKLDKMATVCKMINSSLPVSKFALLGKEEARAAGGDAGNLQRGVHREEVALLDGTSPQVGAGGGVVAAKADEVFLLKMQMKV